MISLPNNIVFISGMTGTKKTLLKNTISHNYENVILYKEYIPEKMENLFEQQLMEIVACKINIGRIIQLAHENPNKLIISTKCIFDYVMYLDMLYSTKRLTGEQYNQCSNTIDSLFNNFNIMPVHVIVLLPDKDYFKNKCDNKHEIKCLDETQINCLWNEYNKLNVSSIIKVTEINVNERMEKIKDYIANIMFDLNEKTA